MTTTRTLPDYDEALEAAISIAQAVTETRSLPLDQSLDQVLAEDVTADRDVPPFNRAQMDGYALRASELEAGRRFPVVTHVAAGMPGDIEVPAGSCVSIATGAPLPPDLDTVIQHEWSDRRDPVSFTVDSIDAGHAVHPRGSDARTDECVVSAGTVLAPHHLGILASVGQTTVTCYRPPRVILLTSGDEVRPPGSPVEMHEIRNSNQVQLIALLSRLGVDVIRAEHIPDEEEQTRTTVAAAVRDADLVLTVGGVSAGTRDFFPGAFDQANIRRAVKGAAIQPGKPVVVGATDDDAIVLALPGNPVSALACACLFGWPLIRSLRGMNSELPWRTVILAESVMPNPRRRAFRPARLLECRDQVVVPTWHGSGDLVHTATTHGLVQLPVQDEPVDAGTELSFLRWP